MVKPFVAFDMVGVIVDEWRIVSQVLFPSLPPGLPVSRDELKARYDDGLRLGRLSRAEFWSGVAADGDWESLEERFLGRLKITDGAATTIKALSRTYRLGIASDLPSNWGNRILRHAGILDDFEVLAFADEHGGARKGDGALFKALREMAGASYAEIVMIDDTPKNLDAARRLGMQGVRFLRESSEEVPDTPYIRTFAELPPLLSEFSPQGKRA